MLYYTFRHSDLIETYNVDLKTLLQQDILEPSGLPGAVYDVRLNLNVLLVK